MAESNPPSLETLLTGFIMDFDDGALSWEQLALLNNVCGTLVASRDCLLTTTGIVVDQQSESRHLHRQLIRTRDEILARLTMDTSFPSTCPIGNTCSLVRRRAATASAAFLSTSVVAARRFFSMAASASV
ncbi:hypothetical protein C8J57DRAFT_1236570 [Mycena rebaudengoi]|nr:hypothetical protein C8J57DRAFT_1236570 [Mycena rebaudengoi]